MRKLNDLNWNHLYCFYQVARAGSLKLGAKALEISASNASEQLKKFEKSLGETLFVRSSKGLQLTDAGLDLAEKARPIFEEGSRLLDSFADQPLGGYPVKVGVEEAISNELSLELTSQYWDMYTEYGTVDTYKVYGHQQLLDDLFKKRLDWGITTRKINRKGLVQGEIGSFTVEFCASTELFKKFVSPEELMTNIPFGESNWDSSTKTSISRHLKSKGIYPKEKIKSDHPEFLEKLCVRGRCITAVVRNPMKSYEGLEFFSFGDPLKINLYAVWKKSDENLISIRKLEELIQSKLSQVPTRYEDVNLQIEVSEVSEEMLK